LEIVQWKIKETLLTGIQKITIQLLSKSKRTKIPIKNWLFRNGQKPKEWHDEKNSKLMMGERN